MDAAGIHAIGPGCARRRRSRAGGIHPQGTHRRSLQLYALRSGELRALEQMAAHRMSARRLRTGIRVYLHVAEARAQQGLYRARAQIAGRYVDDDLPEPRHGFDSGDARRGHGHIRNRSFTNVSEWAFRRRNFHLHARAGTPRTVHRYRPGRRSGPSDALSDFVPGRGKDMPVLVVHGARDFIFPVQITRQTVEMLTDLGCNLKYVELAEWGHAFPYSINERLVLPWFESLPPKFGTQSGS